MPQKHTVNDGDSITSIAETYGLFEETIWMYSDNTELRKKRPNKNILAPGDTVLIPDKEINTEACNSKAKHRFRRKGVPAKFRVQLLELDQPRVNQSYRFDIDGMIRTGTTDSDGVLEEVVPPNANKGLLIVGPDEEHIEFLFGALHPADSVRGFTQRLINLGLFHGDLDTSVDDPELFEAIQAFQHKNSLSATGKIDKATTDKLIVCHDEK